jgi:hypothetical protein
MQITKLIRPSVRADYGMYQPHPALRAPLTACTNLIRLSVGADLSRPSPIYRPSLHLSIYGLFCNHPRQVYTTLQQASTLITGTYSHTITMLI